MNAQTSGTAWVRATPTGRFLVVVASRGRPRPSRWLRAAVVILLMFLLLIGG